MYVCVSVGVYVVGQCVCRCVCGVYMCGGVFYAFLHNMYSSVRTYV